MATSDEFNFAPAWRPDQGDSPTLRGRVEEIAEGFSEYGEYPIVTIATVDDEKFAWHAMTEVAKSQLVRARPEIGHEVQIDYGGKTAETAKARAYHRWKMVNLTTAPKSTAELLAKYDTSPRQGQFTDEPPF